jgi:hypothetical protein
VPAILSSAVAAGSLIAGFAVADATGVRPLGGLVLLAGGGYCWWAWRRAAGTPTAVGLAAAYLGGFVASHPLAKVIGAWPSVLTVSAVVGGLSWALADRRAALPSPFLSN